MIIVAFDQAADSVRDSPWPETEAKVYLISGFKGLMERGLIPESLAPGSWRRFADNVVQLVRSYQRDPKKLLDAVKDLLVVAEQRLNAEGNPGPPLSGSLFRYVLSLVYDPLVNGNLNKFVVVGSSDLAELYGIGEIPKEFDFEDED